MNRVHRWLILGFCGLAGTNALAAEAMTDRVRAIQANQTVLLETGGPATFAEVVFPDPSLIEPWLGSRLLQKEITYTPVGENDRYGRVVMKSDLQEAMLRDGVAVLFSMGHPLKSWQSVEDEARLAGRGIWGKPGFVLTPNDAGEHMQEFHVIEGAITHIYEGKHATYLNFGEDWHTDFSVMIPGRAKRSFAKTLEQLGEGSRVQVRGVITQENGPMIRLSRPEQLEIL